MSRENSNGDCHDIVLANKDRERKWAHSLKISHLLCNRTRNLEKSWPVLGNEAKIVMSQTFEVGNQVEKSYSDGCGRMEGKWLFVWLVASKKMIAGSDKERNASKKFTIFKKWTKKEYKQHSLRKLTTTFRSAVLLARRCPPELRRVLVAIVPQMTASITSTFSRRIGDRSTTCTSPHTALLTCRILLRLALRLPLHPWW
jgi:hypothetical protein